MTSLANVGRRAWNACTRGRTQDAWYRLDCHGQNALTARKDGPHAGVWYAAGSSLSCPGIVSPARHQPKGKRQNRRGGNA